MASAELAWALETIKRNRDAAGVVADRYDAASARASNPALDLPLPAGLRETAIALPNCSAHWLVPAKADTSIRIVYYHGGGYCAGGYHSHRPLAAWLAQHAGCALLFAEYRLAPEHRFPAQFEDGWDAWLHALAHGPEGAAPCRHIYSAGDSAGGGLAVAVAMQARDTGMRAPDAVASLCGMLDFDEESSRFLQMTQRTRDMCRQVVSWLRDLRDPRLSPLHAPMHGLPPILLQSGTQDYCLGDSEAFATSAGSAGQSVTLRIWPEMFHVWQRFAPTLPEADQALREVAAFLTRHG